MSLLVHVVGGVLYICPQCCSLRLEATSVIGLIHLHGCLGCFLFALAPFHGVLQSLNSESIVCAPIFCAYDRNR